jgi:hypothetical protein
MYRVLSWMAVAVTLIALLVAVAGCKSASPSSPRHASPRFVRVDPRPHLRPCRCYIRKVGR